MQVTFRVTKTKLNIPGFRKLRTSPQAKAMVLARAKRMAAAAGSGFVAEPSPSRNRARATVFADTPEARARDAKDLVLLRSISAGR